MSELFRFEVPTSEGMFVVIGPDTLPADEAERIGKQIATLIPLLVNEPEPDECAHETVRDQERIDGIFFGVCVDCHENVCATGPEDEHGEPGWELASREFTGFRGTSVEVV